MNLFKRKQQIKSVTRDVDPGSARDLLERVPRACLAFSGDHGPHNQPVGLHLSEEGYLVSVPWEAKYQPIPGQEAVLLVDEGVYYFDLRAIYIRGQIKSIDAPQDAPTGGRWFELIPSRTVAWDYGTLREVQDER
jgi:hypothetical protein